MVKLLLVSLAMMMLMWVEITTAQCGPAQCYSGCAAVPLVDFVFMVDVSGSMYPKITGVKNGMDLHSTLVPSSWVLSRRRRPLGPLFVS